MSSATSTYGANIAFIEELYEKYRTDPDSVSPSWREFFRDFQEPEEMPSVAAGFSPSTAAPLGGAGDGGLKPAATPAPALPAVVPNAVPLRGAGGQIAQNLEASPAG